MTLHSAKWSITLDRRLCPPGNNAQKGGDNLSFPKFHCSRPCGPMTWKAEERTFLFCHCGGELAKDSCICRADHLEAKHNHSNPGYFTMKVDAPKQ